MGYEGQPQAFEFSDQPLVELPDYFEPLEDDHPHDQCGVYGISAPGQPVLSSIYSAVKKLQHRGQSGAGIGYFDTLTEQLDVYSGNGKVYKAIPDAEPDENGENIFTLSDSSVAVGHVQYTTDKDGTPQPCLGKKFVLGHNGHIEDIDMVLEQYGLETQPQNRQSDSFQLARLLDVVSEKLGSLHAALRNVLPKLEGAYSLTIIDDKQRLIGVRDPWGFRPLMLGAIPGVPNGYVLASEESAFRPTGAVPIRNIERGEIITIDGDTVTSEKIDREEQSAECMFEYIYLARPWETVNGVNVYKARYDMGRYIVEDNPDAFEGLDAIVAVPNSGRSAAAGAAAATGIPLLEGIFVEDGAGRTFILRQGAREEVIDYKYIPNIPLIKGLRLGVLDDSIIKGKTAEKMSNMLKETAGVAELRMFSAAPRYVHACYQGMDTRQTWRLVARGRSDAEVAAEIGADRVVFNSLKRVHQAIRENRTGEATDLCSSCVTGSYPFKSGTFAQKLGEIVTLPQAGGVPRLAIARAR